MAPPVIVSVTPNLAFAQPGSVLTAEVAYSPGTSLSSSSLPLSLTGTGGQPGEIITLTGTLTSAVAVTDASAWLTSDTAGALWSLRSDTAGVATFTAPAPAAGTQGSVSFTVTDPVTQESATASASYSVAALLQPVMGTGLLGAYPGAGNAPPSKFPAPVQVVTRYERLDGNWPSAADVALMTAGQVLAVCWSSQLAAGGAASWADIAAGKHDAAILAQAHRLAALPGPVFAGYDNEMDGATRIAASGPLVNYAAAYRHIHDLVAPVARNVAWCWVPQGGHTAADAAIYPGDAYVDWIGFDEYDPTLAKGSPLAAWSPFVTWLRAQPFGHGKPLCLFETGVCATVPDAQRASWIEGIPAAAQHLGIQMVLWFSDSGTLGDTSIGAGTLSAAAFRSIGAGPFFAAGKP